VIMDSCLLCPRGAKCKGYVLNTLIIKIYKAMHTNAGEDVLQSIAKEFSREDMAILAEYGDSSRVTCWTKGFVMAISNLLANIIAKQKNEAAIQREMSRVINTVLSIYARLPKGIEVNVEDRSMDIYNRTVEIMQTTGTGQVVPLNLFGRVWSATMQERRKAG